jgi:hypothetical protein
VASASVGEAQRRLEQVGKSLKDLSKATAKVSFKSLEKGAKASFAAIGLAAAAATAKVIGLTAAAVKMTESSSDDLAALNQQSKETGVGIADLTTLRNISKSHGKGPDDLFSSLQNVAGSVREIERGLSNSGDAVVRARRFLQLSLPIAARAGDADTINTLIGQSQAAGNTNLEAVQWRMQRLEQRIRSIQSGPISGRLYQANVRNATDQVGLAAMQRAQLQMISPLIAEFQELTEVAKGLRESMGPAGRALEDLKDVGLDAQKVIGGGTGALLEIAGALEKIDDKAKKTEIVRGLFGDTAALPVLLEGRAGIARYQAEKERYGGVETQADGERSTRLKRAELRRNDAIDGLKLPVAREVSPLLEETNNQFAEWLAKNRERIATYVKETFVAVRAVLYDIGKLFEGRTDFDTALFKKGAAVIEWTKTTFATVKEFVVSVGGEIYTQLTKIFSGMDSDWMWLNKVRDAFLAIKSFARDAFAVLTGGKADDYTWLNDLAASAKNFFAHLQEAWGMFRKVLDTIHAAIKPILSFFGTDVLTAALFIGMLRFSGILGGILAAGRGLLGIFGPALAGVGGAAAAAAGQVALIAAALMGAWKLGEYIGGKLGQPIIDQHEKTNNMIAAAMKAQDEARFIERYKKAGS